MARAVLIGMTAASAVACGGETSTSIQVTVTDARWMAIRTAPGEAWQRRDGGDVTFEASGVFDVAVVCREDVGDGWSMTATPDDGTRWTSSCGRAGSVQPQFAVTGRADMVFVGASASYLPNVTGEPIEPGTYDVVAMQVDDGIPARVLRVQVIRDVVVDGTAPIAIDVDRLGLAPETMTVRVAGSAPDFAFVNGTTAGGTWFTFLGGDPMALPAALTVAGDRHVASVYDGSAWAEVPVRAGDNDVFLPAVTVMPTFAPGPAVTWPVSSEWPLVTLGTSQWIEGSASVPWWRLHAYSGAVAAATVDGVARVELNAPDVEGWKPTWMTDLSRPHVVNATWSRPRADGGREGLRFSQRNGVTAAAR